MLIYIAMGIFAFLLFSCNFMIRFAIDLYHTPSGVRFQDHHTLEAMYYLAVWRFQEFEPDLEYMWKQLGHIPRIR